MIRFYKSDRFSYNLDFDKQGIECLIVGFNEVQIKGNTQFYTEKDLKVIIKLSDEESCMVKSNKLVHECNLVYEDIEYIE